MMRQTGGTAVAAISTRSRPFVRAMASACGGGMMPSCEPSSSMTRTSRTLMRSLTRVRSSRRGLRSNAINPPLYVFQRGLRPTPRLVASGDPCAPRRSSRARVARLAGSRQALCCRSLRLHFAERLRGAVVPAPPPETPAAPAPHRHGALRGLPIARDEHVGNLLDLSLADLISDLLLPGVQLDPEARRRQAVPDRRRVGRMTVRDGQQDDLHRRQPEREGPGIVLEQERDEPLEAAEDSPMDHDRPVLGVVGADVHQVEVLRLLVIELDGGALPLPPDRIRDVEVDLRPVERAVLRVDVVGETGRVERRLQLLLRVVPRRDLAEELVRPGRELRREVEPEVAVDALDEPDEPRDFRSDLLLRDEAARIVLRELADAGQAREPAGGFVPAPGRLLAVA